MISSSVAVAVVEPAWFFVDGLSIQLLLLFFVSRDCIELRAICIKTGGFRLCSVSVDDVLLVLAVFLAVVRVNIDSNRGPC
ncbi:hypothetical protein [Accumulibacter sp.]|uniref:hypothetical protein n=1 Tax=Accumulibacter sp. TaxID=2053492 RepID=UPI0004ACFC83|nr:hypothetical protein [Accumulibacter sp.]HRF05944.1 hypothetical protein [Accumulibacter sp.]